MPLPSEVGLQLLLCPLGSNIVVRTACCSIGIVLPVYSTFKAIEKKEQAEQQRWLIYWAAYGSFSVVEMFAEKLLSWIPLYYHIKFAFLVWLQLPTTDGARLLYARHLQPFLLKHQARLDQIMEFMYSEMSKFISAHHAEFQFARTLLVKAFATACQMIRDFSPPVERQGKRSVEHQKRLIQDSVSEGED